MDVLRHHSHNFQPTPTWYERACVNGPSIAPIIGSPSEAPQSLQSRRYGTFKQRVQQMHERGPGSPGAAVISMAVPVQQTTAVSNQNTEHMLRRKTPNGTLVGGYDGRPSGWNPQTHVNKHYVVPAVTTEQHASSDSLAEPHSGSERPRHRKIQDTNPTLWPLTCQSTKSIPYLKVPYGEAQSQNHQVLGMASLPVCLSAGMDSVLYQQPCTQPGPDFLAGQYIPTALQPMWPPCGGATSMNKPGPTGPYWPNGAYEPYRPAPFQNTGLPCRSDYPYYNHNDSQSQVILPATIDHRNVHGTLLPDSLKNQLDHRFIDRPQNCDTASQFAKAVRTPNFIFDTQRDSDFASVVASDPRSEQHAFGRSEPGHEYHHGSNDVHFRHRVLLWAHRIYLNLLSTLDTSPRISPISQQQTRHRRRHQPYVPAQTYERQSNRQSNRKSFSDHLQSRIDRCSSDTHPVQTSRALREFGHQTNSGPSVHGLPSKVRNLSLGHHSETGPYEHPTNAAVTAIEVLNRLCRESEWKWSEGILLGGCLAYGLGDYSSAQKWYTRLLSRDSSNVEAISNLAATCISLGRPQEAEILWNRAVKLRPNFFEAVEHLVGLYCENRRPQEAVKVIAFVQASLQDQESQLSQRGSNSGAYMICPQDNGRLIGILHGKGNMLYALGDNSGAAKAFEDAILVGCGQSEAGVEGLITKILKPFSGQLFARSELESNIGSSDEPVLLDPKTARKTSQLLFPPAGDLPGLGGVLDDSARKAAISIISNSLLSLAKIYQDGMSSAGASSEGPLTTAGVRDILSLYYLSLSLQPSPSTANNVGILLAGIQQSSSATPVLTEDEPTDIIMPGVVVGSGIWLALKYYKFGLELDQRHAHLYTNLGSLFKDMGQLAAAIAMYQRAVDCDGNFDIALANLANAVKDQGRISDAISYYQRAVKSNPDFAEAVCGLSNALNSVCDWNGRGGIRVAGGTRDRWHIDDKGMLFDAKASHLDSSGWIARVVAIVDKQLQDGETWGKGVIHGQGVRAFLQQIRDRYSLDGLRQVDIDTFNTWLENRRIVAWEGACVVRLVERATKRIGWRVYRKRHLERKVVENLDLMRPQLPTALTIPGAPTVLPFHTFTCPLNSRQIRRISQRNGLRISCSTLKAPWLPAQVYEPPPPPNPHLNVGYVSSDFNNHPLAHLMQSVFGMHDKARVKAFCYATTASDGSVHRKQIEKEAPTFYDASSWSADNLVKQIVRDRIHILINLNGYTRGARNEIFAARPSPVQMSFMGFAGTLGAEWCDYLLADKIAVPASTLRPYRRNVDLFDLCHDGNNRLDPDDWMYGENIIFTRDTFFCCDHRQSAPDAKMARLSWTEAQERRWQMRKDLFPDLPDDAIILANFNQLYKIDPGTFRTWLRILSRVPKAILWLLRFPELGEHNLRQTAFRWVGSEVASRIVFTDVAPKHEHITRATVGDLFLDTPECNAHTTAADVLWSGTPLLTMPRYDFKMCSRMAASILRGALPKTVAGDQAARTLTVSNEDEYEERAVELATGLTYPSTSHHRGMGKGQLVDLRRLLYESRWTSALFDTRRWVRDLEDAYDQAWSRWVSGQGGDIVL